MIDRPAPPSGRDARDWIDISVPVGVGTPEWPGDRPYECGWTMRRSAGPSVNLGWIATSPHTGTHADAPLHVEDEWPASETLPLDAFNGDVLVVDVRSLEGPISLDQLETAGRVRGASRLLLQTGRTIADGRFPEDWPWLDSDCIAALLDSGLRLLGVDCPSVDAKMSKGLKVHHRLFERSAYNLENLDLRNVTAGVYELIALPWRVVALDAAPVRAVLVPR